MRILPVEFSQNMSCSAPKSGVLPWVTEMFKYLVNQSDVGADHLNYRAEMFRFGSIIEAK
jgi:hypothetical protein